MSARNTGGDVGLHIHRKRARGLMKFRFSLSFRHHGIAANDSAQARGRPQGRDDGFRPGSVGLPSRDPIRYALADDPVSDSQLWGERAT